MMEIIPAIDLIGQKCVRLIEGDFARKTEYSDDPVAQALSFQDYGVTRLHVVDLEGAKSSSPKHLKVLEKICSSTNLIVDFGGGVREAKDVEAILSAGARMVSLGSVAVKDPGKVEGWITSFGADKFFLGADVLRGMIATDAWQNVSSISVNSFIQSWIDRGIKSFFSTDVTKDGKLEGPAFELYDTLVSKFPEIELVASGGVSEIGELPRLAESGVSGVIIGKAIYEGRISMNQLKPWL